MKNPILLLLLCACTSGNLHAQEEDTIRLGWKMTTKPTEMLLGNIAITIEKVFKHRTVGLTVAYRPAYSGGGDMGGGATGMFGEYQYQYYVNKVVEGLYTGINSKNYFQGTCEGFYLDPELFYRRWWCNGKNGHYDNVEGYRFDATRTETVNVYGLKILAGYSFVMCKHWTTKIVMDVYGGLGVRYKSWVYDSDNGTVNGIYYLHHTDAGNATLPSVHVGVQIGIGF